jgi:hypothetical protein
VRARAVAIGVVLCAPVGVGEDVIGVAQVTPESVLPATLERDATVRGLDLLRRGFWVDAEGCVVIGQSRLLRLL